jgi:rhamnulokinase
MKTLNVLGMDYGASNGRGIVGRFDGNRLSIEEIHRFPNHAIRVFSNIYWDILSLFNEMKKTLIKIRAESIPISSIGIDSWGIDFGILDGQGNLMGNPHCYRDPRTTDILQEAFRIYDEYTLFSRTGMYPTNIGTLFQLLAMKASEASILEKGRTLLFIPNLLSYFLTGNIGCESTMASTSLLYSPFTGEWLKDLLAGYGLPEILPPIVAPGSTIGTLLQDIAMETGVGKVPVISVAQHDTASAIASVPALDKEKVVYISCGTWSVVGTGIKKPLVNEKALQSRFNNEMGFGNEIMFVKNITGLWILQECVREWMEEGYVVHYDSLNAEAEKCRFDSWIDVDSSDFTQPGNMSRKIREFCRKTGQREPQGRVEMYKCILLSLAHKYRETIDELKELTGNDFERIHMVGGGSRNGLLCRMTSRLTGKEVAAGPYEATVIGNLIAQLISLGEVKDTVEGIEIIRDSFPLVYYRPEDTDV